MSEQAQAQGEPLEATGRTSSTTPGRVVSAEAWNGPQDPPRPRPSSRAGRWLAVIGGMRPTLVDPFAGDRQHYGALAFLLFATMSLAMVSGGFAVTQAFPATDDSAGVPLLGAVAFGVLWGLIIFAIDRYMVLGLDGVHGPRALILMTFRAVLALVLGLVMATPLVIAILRSDLDTHIRIIEGERLQELQVHESDAKAAYDELRAASDAALAELAAAQGQRTPSPDDDPVVVRTRQTLESSQQACAQAELTAAQEYNGVLPQDRGGSGRQGSGPQYEALAAAARVACAQAEADAAAYATAVAAASVVPADIDVLVAARQTAVEEARMAADNAWEWYAETHDSVLSAEASSSSGLLTSLSALSRLLDGAPAVAATATTSAKPAVEGDRLAWWTHAGLVAVLISIELMPVLFKGTRQALHGWGGKEYSTPYERACRDQDEAAAARLSIWDAETTQAWRTEASLVSESAHDMRTRQLTLHQDMNADIVRTQRVLMRHALRQWRREQAARWGTDPRSLESEVERMESADVLGAAMR